MRNYHPRPVLAAAAGGGRGGGESRMVSDCGGRGRGCEISICYRCKGWGEGWRVNIMEGGPDVRAQSAISWGRARRCGPGVLCGHLRDRERDQSVLKVSDQ